MRWTLASYRNSQASRTFRGVGWTSAPSRGSFRTEGWARNKVGAEVVLDKVIATATLHRAFATEGVDLVHPDVPVIRSANVVPQHSPPGSVGQVITAARATPLPTSNAAITVNRRIAVCIFSTCQGCQDPLPCAMAAEHHSCALLAHREKPLVLLCAAEGRVLVEGVARQVLGARGDYRLVGYSRP